MKASLRLRKMQIPAIYGATGPFLAANMGKVWGVFCMFPLADLRQTGTIVRAGPWGFKWDPLHVCPTRQHRDMRPFLTTTFRPTTALYSSKVQRGGGRGSLLGRLGDKRCVLLVFRRVPVVSEDANGGPGGVCSHRGRLAGEDEL